MKVILNEITETFINSIVKTDIENLVKFQALYETPLLWCNCILFYIQEIEAELVKIKQTQGKLYLESFIFAECKTKPDFLKYNGFQVEIIDVTDYQIYYDLTTKISLKKWSVRK